MIKIVVGSRNPVKLNAAEHGIMSALEVNLCEMEVEGIDVKSGVRDQPIGDDEIVTGATNRAIKSFTAYKERHGQSPTYGIGIEGGILVSNEETVDEEMSCFAWIVIYNGTHLGKARTASFTLPPAICKLVKEGMELGHADDTVFKRTNSKQEDGTVGYLTKGVIDRTAFYTPAVVLAMVPLQWPELYN
jgi:inosine/xanthosine triphosphatase